MTKYWIDVSNPGESPEKWEEISLTMREFLLRHAGGFVLERVRGTYETINDKPPLFNVCHNCGQPIHKNPALNRWYHGPVGDGHPNCGLEATPRSTETPVPSITVGSNVYVPNRRTHYSRIGNGRVVKETKGPAGKFYDVEFLDGATWYDVPEDRLYLT